MMTSAYLPDWAQKVLSSTDSNLVRHAVRELQIAGLLESDDPMDEAMAKHLVEMVRLFADAGHSGFSAGYAAAMLDKLIRFKPLTPISREPDEWQEVGPQLWQNVRDSECFSENGGKTYYRLSEKPSFWHRAFAGRGFGEGFGIGRQRPRIFHTSPPRG